MFPWVVLNAVGFYRPIGQSDVVVVANLLAWHEVDLLLFAKEHSGGSNWAISRWLAMAS